MSYTIQLTNGNILATIPDGTINTSACSQTLIGKNYAGYGQFLDDNFVHLLENAANPTPPGAPLTGQLWFNTTTNVLQVFNGTGFKPLGGSQASATAPTNNSVGDLWYDSTNQQLNVWTGSAWLLVGPIYNSATGKTGAIPAIIGDTTGNSHIVTELYVNNNLVGLISDDAGGWSPNPAISGFANVYPGIQLASTVNGQVPEFTGTSTKALYADVAERFAADTEYAPGTVVELGGTAEITQSNTELSESVFGVISTKAAYLMNSGAGNNATHPPVAMTGRVPVQVTGVVQKGDRLVSAGSGMARSAQPGEATAFNVIGRALESKQDAGLGTIEAIVTIK